MFDLGRPFPRPVRGAGDGRACHRAWRISAPSPSAVSPASSTRPCPTACRATCWPASAGSIPASPPCNAPCRRWSWRTAASSMPGSVDSIPGKSNAEDHVSNSTWCGRKARTIVENVEQIVAGELLMAAQALTLVEPDREGLSARQGLARRHRGDPRRHPAGARRRPLVRHRDGSGARLSCAPARWSRRSRAPSARSNRIREGPGDDRALL